MSPVFAVLVSSNVGSIDYTNISQLTCIEIRYVIDVCSSKWINKLCVMKYNTWFVCAILLSVSLSYFPPFPLCFLKPRSRYLLACQTSKYRERGFRKQRGNGGKYERLTDKSIAHTNHVLYFITHNLLIHLLEQTSMTYLISIHVSWEILV